MVEDFIHSVSPLFPEGLLGVILRRTKKSKLSFNSALPIDSLVPVLSGSQKDVVEIGGWRMRVVDSQMPEMRERYD